jgi:hypothetical protein
MPVKQHRPFWLPASNYYILAVSAATACFFFIWGAFHETNDETPWVDAGIAAIFVLGAAVFLREVIMRKARLRYLQAQKLLDYNFSGAAAGFNSGVPNPNKLTLEKNAAILKEIRRKSDAAKVLGKLPDGHLEVFEICEEYLSISRNELKTVGVGSPRLAALRRGREIVKELHRFHLLEWAETSARAFTQEAKSNVIINERLEATQKALNVIHKAMQFYPNEAHLKSSEDALNEFIASIRVSHFIEEAERSAFKGNYANAVNHYRDALFYLGRENVKSDQREAVAEQINSEIEKIEKLETLNKPAKVKKQINKKSSPDFSENYD